MGLSRRVKGSVPGLLCSGARVKLQLRSRDRLARDFLDGIRRIRQQVGQHGALCRGEVVQHEVRRGLAPGGTTDPDANPQEFAGPDRGDDVPDAVVAAVAPAILIRMLSNGMSSSSCTTMSREGSSL